MKKIIQLVLFLLLITIALLFYKTYFSENKENVKILDEDQDQVSVETQNNLIKNLRYDVRLDENKQYIITAESSELSYEDDVEVVKMQKVIGIFVDETNIPITITSDYAIYNNSTYDTNFYENVKVEYIDNIILSDKLDLNFDKNIVTIYDNVLYEGFQGTIKADNVIINLITKNIEIYMNNKTNKVEVVTKQ
jgi:LPS export ABC transporter protein LptC